MRMRGIRRDRGDDGFTLVEMIVTITIMGVISFALFGVVIEYLRTSSTTESRLSESTDQQFVSTYWQADVSSLGTRATYRPADPDPLPPSKSVWVNERPPGNCGSGAGDPVVAFTWTDFKVGTDEHTAWDYTSQAVAYVAVGPDSGGQYVLKRVRCGAGSGTPITVAHSLTAPPVPSCNPSCDPAGSLPDRVSLSMNVRNLADPRSAGYTTVLTADRRQG